jgi:O-antigen/teichoic acid export membrane protein
LTKSLVDLLWVASPKVLSGGGQLLTNLLLVRQLGPERSGVVFVCITAILLSDAVFGSAVDVAVVRLATGGHDGGASRFLQVQKAALVAKTVGCVLLAMPIAFWSAALSTVLFHGDGDATVIVLSMFSVFGLLVLRSAQTFFQLSGRFKAFGAVDLLHSAFRFGGIGLLFAAGRVTPPMLLTLTAIAPLSVAVVVLVASSARRVLTAPFSSSASRDLLGIVKWYLGAAAFSSINSRMDILLVSALAGTGAAGLFSAAQVCVLPFQLLGMYLALVFAPRILPLRESGQLSPVYFRFQAWTIAASVLTYGIVFFSVDALATRLLPASYGGARSLILLLLPSSLLALVNFPWTVSFLMFTHPRVVFVMEVCAFPVLFLIYRWLVRLHGAAGAAALTSAYALLKTAIFQILAAVTIRRDAVRSARTRLAVMPHGARAAVAGG